MHVKIRRLATLLICLCAVPAYAQFDTASVVGTVRDATAAAVADATLRPGRRSNGAGERRIHCEIGRW
jgi:hypothetical protein